MFQGGRISLFIACLCAMGLPVCAQQGPTPTGSVAQVMGKAIGRLVVDGTLSESTITIFVDNDVVVDPNGVVSLISRGNSLIFAPKSKFQAMHNGYRLQSGGSKVASYSGMTAHLPNCYSVRPVRLDTLTQYEVNWSGAAAYVYARKQDVRINYWVSGEPDPKTDHNSNHPDHDWIVKQGHWARINDVKLCKPAVFLWPEPNLPTALELSGATGFFVSIPFWDMSSEHP